MIKMKNVFIIHSYNGDTANSFAPSIKKLCEENNINYYFPEFPIRQEAKYESWEKILNEYVDKELLNEDSIVISHSLGTLFLPKYLAKNNIKINTYISVAGFLNYKGRIDLENIIIRFLPNEQEFEKCKTLIKNIYSIYSDNDEINSIKNLEDYANKLNSEKIFIKGAGHFSPKSNVKNISELNEIILETNIKH